jgi:isoquinoline 1-oxidoreductase
VFHASKTPLRQGSYRALAATANHYAREMHMDEMARALGVDPFEFRMRHLESDARMRAVLTAVAKKIGWPKPSASGRSLGIACGTEKAGWVATAAEVSKQGTGFKVERIVIAFECGAIVNPDGLKNQVEGSVVQGLGGALFESISFADGRVLNGSMAQYRVPRFQDVPSSRRFCSTGRTFRRRAQSSMRHRPRDRLDRPRPRAGRARVAGGLV